MMCLRLAVCVMIAPAIIAAQTGRGGQAGAGRDSSGAANDTAAFVMTKSPLIATLLSAVVPGAGQFYNEEYYKIPVIWAAGGFLLYEMIANNNQFVKYQDMYFNSADSTVRGSQQYFNLKEQYRDDRDYYGALLFLVYALNVLDAYVGAHLFDFNVGDSHFVREARIAPAIGNDHAVGLGVELRFR